MQIHRLQLESFRNFERASVEFTPGVNILLGANGSGKTNLLEAISTVCLGRSQRLNATDQTLVKSGDDFYRLVGALSEDGHEREVAVAYQAGRGKRVTIDEQPARTSELFRAYSVVALAPEDSEIISGGPGVRRRFLDFHLAQSSAAHLDDLSQYQRTLAQRNSHLKQFGLDDNGTPFDDQLIEIGARITSLRAEFLATATDLAAQTYKAISGGSAFGVSYFPSALLSSAAGEGLNPAPTDVNVIIERFRERLRSRQAAEAAREITLVGPHRDDFTVTIRGLPARTHGSQGEWRSAAIALKLAVFEFLKSRKKNAGAPLLLLDEVFAELDLNRQRALVDAFADYGQLFVTTALEAPTALSAGAEIFTLADGAITDVTKK